MRPHERFGRARIFGFLQMLPPIRGVIWTMPPSRRRAECGVHVYHGDVADPRRIERQQRRGHFGVVHRRRPCARFGWAARIPALSSGSLVAAHQILLADVARAVFPRRIERVRQGARPHEQALGARARSLRLVQQQPRVGGDV